MGKDKKLLLDFLQSQKLFVIASVMEDGTPYPTNVYMGVDDDCKIYFISSENTKHSQQILNNPEVAFGTAWFNGNDHTDRKGVQGKGKCRIANSEEEVKKGVELHNKNYPEFAERITPEWVKSNSNDSHVWVIEPSFIKYWDDEHFGEDPREIKF